MAVNRVANMVRRELDKNPQVPNDTLLEKAKSIDPALVRGLSPRQFHATFRLPALRELHSAHNARRAKLAATVAAAPEATAASPDPADVQPAPDAAPAAPLAKASERDAVRALLEDIVRDALSVEDRTGFVRLFTSLEERATAILALFGRV